MAHQTNLIMQIMLLNIYKIFSKNIYLFFYHSYKQHIEFMKSTYLMKIKGNKILCNFKIC